MATIAIPIALKPHLVKDQYGNLVQHYHKDKHGNSIKTMNVVTTLLEVEKVRKMQDIAYRVHQRWGKGQKFIDRYCNLLWKYRHGNLNS